MDRIIEPLEEQAYCRVKVATHSGLRRLRTALTSYFDSYNLGRPEQGLNLQTPSEEQFVFKRRPTAHRRSEPAAFD